jgi:hypothetical protein
MEDEKESKKINITGINNRYMMNKLISDKKVSKETKRRVVSENWSFSLECYQHSNQLKMIRDISNNSYSYIDETTKIIIQEINKKITGYKSQDLIKKVFDTEQFLTFDSIITKMIECELRCRYCNSEMAVLYDISREMKQWSVDRINNDKGHNLDNFHLACLDCNLKRRRRTDEKFLFTKQLNIIKKNDIN